MPRVDIEWFCIIHESIITRYEAYLDEDYSFDDPNWALEETWKSRKAQSKNKALKTVTNSLFSVKCPIRLYF